MNKRTFSSVPDCIATELCAVTVIKHTYSSVKTASGAAASSLHMWSYDRTFPGKETTADMPAKGAKLVRTVSWPSRGVAFKQSVKQKRCLDRKMIWQCILHYSGICITVLCTTMMPSPLRDLAASFISPTLNGPTRCNLVANTSSALLPGAALRRARKA